MDIRQQLTAYVADEPPQTLSAAAVLHAGRRASRAHRIRSTTAFAAMATVVAVLIPTLVSRPSSVDGAWSPPAGAVTLDPASVCAAAAAATPPVAVRDDDGFPPLVTPTGHEVLGRDVDRTAARLRCAVTELAVARLPGFEFYRVGESDHAHLAAPLEFLVSSGPTFSAYAVLADGEGGAMMTFTVAPTEASPPTEQRCDGCTQTRGQRGERIAYRESDEFMLVEVRWGRTLVEATLFTQDLRYWRSPALAQHRDQLPLTLAQLIDIVSDARLDVFTEP